MRQAQPPNLVFVVPGRLGGKGRARAFVRGGKIAMHTPGKTAADESVVRHFAAEAMREAKTAPLEGPLRLEITISRMIPKSWSAKKRQGAFWITGKPDCDNSAKLIADALNGITYGDDSQVAVLTVRRTYGLPECTVVKITELGGPHVDAD